MSNLYRLHANARARKGDCVSGALLPPHALAAAYQEISSWPNYQPTPLTSLAGLAKAKNLSRIWYKDEGMRFGLGSFKALGGAYALYRVLRARVAEESGMLASSGQLRSGVFRDLTRNITVTTATDGNHGRAVAWGARLFHCRCVVYVPRTCSRNREMAIANLGAEVVRSSLGYDETVHQCARDAERNGWLLVSDTSWEGYEHVPALVMQGYSVMSAEIVQQLGPNGPPTHIFVQGGVGGLAASIYAYFCQVWGKQRPRLILVESSGAACLLASALAGKPTPVEGEAQTIMAGLECGEVSLAAWKLLSQGAEFFMTIPDSVVPDCMRLLATPPYGDPPIVAGESAIAGLAGLLHAMDDPEFRDQMGLAPDSKVLLFGTESDTDPDLYRELTGKTSAEVRGPLAPA
jgi:diaminopropionate ammonia-lyase